MATLDECRDALDRFSANLASAEGGARDAAALDRSLSCHVTDLGSTFTGRLAYGRLQDVTAVSGVPAAKAQIRLTMKSDDLLAMVAGDLHFAKAWASGRVKVHAGLRDVLRLRSLL
jgi:Alkyl sulfatase C-terminal